MNTSVEKTEIPRGFICFNAMSSWTQLFNINAYQSNVIHFPNASSSISSGLS